ncbi:MAG: tRNA pseudouridine(55) synthase TruB, partial [candidate division WOR-3 bacterium]
RLARAGEAPEPAARSVTAYELRLVDWNPPEATVRAVVSAGFYVRSLARDLGTALGTCATLSHLIRTRIGQFSREAAVRPDDVNSENVSSLLTPIPDALSEVPRVEVSDAEAADLLHGRPVMLETLPGSDIAFALSRDSRFLALVAVTDSSIHTRRVIHAH